MAAYLPHKKGFAGYTTRFWHPAYVNPHSTCPPLKIVIFQRWVCSGLELSYEISCSHPKVGPFDYLTRTQFLTFYVAI
jgi:hypothetical protein